MPTIFDRRGSRQANYRRSAPSSMTGGRRYSLKPAAAIVRQCGKQFRAAAGGGDRRRDPLFLL